MSLIQRFRDAASGLFVSPTHADRNQSTTVAESPSKGLSRLNRRILANAIQDEKHCTGSIAANHVLRTAILKVLGDK